MGEHGGARGFAGGGVREDFLEHVTAKLSPEGWIGIG